VKYYVIDPEDSQEQWCLFETHLAVEEDLNNIPQTSKGNRIPGQFEY